MEKREVFSLINSILTEEGVLSSSKVEEVEREIEKRDIGSYREMEDILVEMGLVTEEALLRGYSKYFNIPYIELGKVKIEQEALSLVPVKFVTKNNIIPVRREANSLYVALRDPFDVNILDELRILTNLEIKPFLAKQDEILKAIKNYYGLGAETVEELVEKTDASLEVREEISEGIIKDTSIINYVDQLLLEAYRKRATDIHIEPFSDKLRIRFRIDGFLYEAKTPKEIKKLHSSIISRFKIMGNLNIAEKRKPQDGRCRVNLEGQEVDLRLSTFPTLFGEGLTVRLLVKSSIMLGLNQLGFSPEDLEKIKSILSKTNGMILVTGPTGCGKTTTLYSFLSYLNDSRIKIVTLEDPIEYQLEGIDQIQINPKIDLTFAEGLRSILRQDPDVIMVGEIRDLETAQIATRAALTGHLLFSTLHTNNSISTITRLLDLGIESYLLADTLRAVVAQRLVRVICNNCKEEYIPKQELIDNLGIKEDFTFFRGRGCKDCNNTGYRGRTAIFELLIVEESLSSLISQRVPLESLANKASSLGFKTLREDGLEKVKRGLTTVEEVIRVCEQLY